MFKGHLAYYWYVKCLVIVYEVTRHKYNIFNTRCKGARELTNEMNYN